METKNRACIICLNYKYFPDSNNVANVVGASSFTLNIIDCLQKYQTLGGIILYKRDETIQTPTIEARPSANCPVLILHFNFGMEHAAVQTAILSAVQTIKSKQQLTLDPIVYYQTDTLLKYHPTQIPSFITHHGPFARDFIEHYSLTGAVKAYGSKAKVEHLMTSQAEGLVSLKAQQNAYVLQHSRLQKDCLIEYGLAASRIFKMVPPIIVPSVETPKVRAEIADFAEADPATLFLISTVARLDYFKNLDLLVEAAVALRQQQLPVKVIIAGDALENEVNRHELLKRIPAEFQADFLICERLPKDELYSLFALMKQRAIFVCTSRYETLAITPLEAALLGVYTIVPNLPQVEVASYMGIEEKFTYSLADLTALLLDCYQTKLYQRDYQLVHVQQQLDKRLFERSFMDAVAQVD
ncbi:MAG: glycosyltransferase [Lactobacillaceae bacterium]|jgi:glycosyltransferase involved in cell wall biosynthesis|nr:glycosyltransferase [Lactobacillaceae bacterium]